MADHTRGGDAALLEPVAPIAHGTQTLKSVPAGPSRQRATTGKGRRRAAQQPPVRPRNACQQDPGQRNRAERAGAEPAAQSPAAAVADADRWRSAADRRSVE